MSADQARQMISDRVDELARALETALRKELPTFALEVSLFGIKPPFAGQEDKQRNGCGRSCFTHRTKDGGMV